MSTEVTNGFKKKMKVQALDPETKHWLFATITDMRNHQGKVSWVGYPRTYDCWLEWEYIRLPVLKRLMLSRNAIIKENFKIRQDPKYFEKDDVVFDTGRKMKFVVATNDPFKSEITTTSGEAVMYEFLTEVDDDEDDDDEDDDDKDENINQGDSSMLPPSDNIYIDEENLEEELLEAPRNSTDELIDILNPLQCLELVFNSQTAIIQPPAESFPQVSAVQPVSPPHLPLPGLGEENVDDTTTILISILEEIKAIKADITMLKSAVNNVESKLEDVESVVITIDRTIRKKQDRQKIKRTTTIPNNTHAEHGQLPNNRTFANNTHAEEHGQLPNNRTFADNTHAEEHGQISNNSTFVELFKNSLTYDV